LKTIHDETVRAHQRIRRYVRETYLEYSPAFSDLCAANIDFKLENLQHTGSFKVRGALNKLLTLSDTERKHGVVAASTGNPGAAVAFAMDKLGIDGTIFVPVGAARNKITAIEKLGGHVQRVGDDSIETERYARKFADENGQTYVSPYNDLAVVAGQGTIGLEIDHQLDRIDTVITSLGGGGLAAGVAGYLSETPHRPEFIAVSPSNSCVMIDSVQAGRVLDQASNPTLSDGTAGGIEDNAITLKMCTSLIDQYVKVSEKEIATALREFVNVCSMMVEGAAAAALAGLLKTHHRLAGRNIVVVMCGGNIGVDQLREVLEDSESS